MNRGPLWKNLRKRTRQYIRRAGLTIKVSAYMELDRSEQDAAIRAAVESK